MKKMGQYKNNKKRKVRRKIENLTKRGKQGNGGFRFIYTKFKILT